MSWKFHSLRSGFIPTPYRESFAKAFEDMYVFVSNALSTGLTIQELETSLWIVTPDGTPMFFYAARDKAWDLGIMVDIQRRHP